MKKISAFERERTQAELDYLNTLIPELKQRVKIARAHGDLSENEEYHTAQADLQKAIASKSQKEVLLEQAEVVEDDGSDVIIRASVVEVSIPSMPEFGTRLLVVSDEGEGITKGVLNTDCRLGQAVLGMPSGLFDIQKEDGTTLIYKVQKQPVTRTKELIEMYPPEKEFYKNYFDGV